MYFARFVYKQDHLRLSINFVTRKIKAKCKMTLTAGTVKITSKVQLKSLLQVTVHFHLRSQSKEHQHTGDSFCMVYQLCYAITDTHKFFSYCHMLTQDQKFLNILSKH